MLLFSELWASMVCGQSAPCLFQAEGLNIFCLLQSEELPNDAAPSRCSVEQLAEPAVLWTWDKIAMSTCHGHKMRSGIVELCEQCGNCYATPWWVHVGNPWSAPFLATWASKHSRGHQVGCFRRRSLFCTGACRWKMVISSLNKASMCNSAKARISVGFHSRRGGRAGVLSGSGRAGMDNTWATHRKWSDPGK